MGTRPVRDSAEQPIKAGRRGRQRHATPLKRVHLTVRGVVSAVEIPESCRLCLHNREVSTLSLRSPIRAAQSGLRPFFNPSAAAESDVELLMLSPILDLEGAYPRGLRHYTLQN